MNSNCERALREIGSVMLECPPRPPAPRPGAPVDDALPLGIESRTSAAGDVEDPTASGPGDGTLTWERLPDDTRSHLRSCASCRRELAALERVEHVLFRGFEEFDQATRLPDSDQITTILRRATDETDTRLWRRTRRSVRTILWLSLLLFGMLGACGLIALAYRVLFSGR